MAASEGLLSLEVALCDQAEEHLVRTGVSAMISQFVGGTRPVPMGAVGMRGYAESGGVEELLEKYGLSADSIVEEVKSTVARK